MYMMKKSTEGEMDKASTTEAKLSSKVEYVEKLRKDNEVRTCTYIRTYIDYTYVYFI